MRDEIWKVIGTLMEDQILPSVRQEDLDCDGYDELYLRCAFGDVSCVPVLGASLTMLLIPGVGNINNVLTRRIRAWHADIASDPRLPRLIDEEPGVPEPKAKLLVPQNPYFYNKLGYDAHHRGLFADVLYDRSVQLYKLRKGQARILKNLTKTAFRILSVEEDEHATHIDMEAHVAVPTFRGVRSLTIQKYYSFFHLDRKIRVAYTVENNSLEPIESIFGVEFNVGRNNALRPNIFFRIHPQSFSCSFLQAGHRKRCVGAEWVFPEGSFQVSISEECEAFFYPVETPCAQPTYIEMGFQGHCLMYGVPLDLWAGEQKSWSIECVWERE